MGWFGWAIAVVGGYLAWSAWQRRQVPNQPWRENLRAKVKLLWPGIGGIQTYSIRIEPTSPRWKAHYEAFTGRKPFWVIDTMASRTPKQIVEELDVWEFTPAEIARLLEGETIRTWWPVAEFDWVVEAEFGTTPMLAGVH